MQKVTPNPEIFHEFLRSRRSVRQFLPEPVPETTIRRILQTACRAPSAHNRQPWRFAVLAAREARVRLADAMGVEFRRDLRADGLGEAEVEKLAARSHARITAAPATVVLCLTAADMDAYPDRPRRRAEFRMAVQSVALAGGQLLLAAHAEGLGAVWVCAPLFAQDAVRDALSLPADWEPQGMILMGRPAVPGRERERRDLDEISVFV